jgi:hypothetical protein
MIVVTQTRRAAHAARWRSAGRRPAGSRDKHPRFSATERIGRSHQEVIEVLAGIERKLGQDHHAGQLGEIAVLLKDNVLRRLVSIERALGLVEQPETTTGMRNRRRGA